MPLLVRADCLSSESCVLLLSAGVRFEMAFSRMAGACYTGLKPREDLRTKYGVNFNKPLFQGRSLKKYSIQSSLSQIGSASQIPC